MKKIDLVGQRFGRLVVLEDVGRNKNGLVLWECKCDCGNTKITTSNQLRTGGIKSCGCLQKERKTTHGMYKTPEYQSWHHMKTRCENPKSNAYKHYGGRGIKVCKRWHDFAKFYKDMGNRPEGTSIDRIDNDGDYKPSNCRWASCKTQANNSRHNHLITINMETKTLAEWCSLFGLSQRAISHRIARGWDEIKALTTPLYNKHTLTDYSSSAKPVKQLTTTGVFIKIWSSVNKAGRSLRASPSNISMCALGRCKTAGGFKWEYLIS